MEEKLKIKDVMVGDWVDVRNNAAPNTSHFERITPSHFLRNEHWYGVELVPEILEKNEIDTVFKTRYKGFYLEYHAEAGMIMLYVYNNGSFQSTGIGFKYVHELQHALRLCGIEKEIIL